MKALTNRRCPDPGYGATVARAIDRQIEVSSSSVDDSLFAPRHYEGLKSLSTLLRSLSGEDPRIWSLWNTQSRGGGSTDDWTPGENVQTFLSTVGMLGDLDADLPDAGQLIDELVALAADDALEQQQQLARHRPPEQQAQADAAIRESHDRIDELEEQVASLTAALGSAEATNSSLEAALANLKRLAAAIGKPPVELESNSQGANNKVQSQAKKTKKRRVRRIQPKHAATTTTEEQN